jgi:murein tripeptide amidase MpaA
MKKITIGVLVVALIIGGLYYLFFRSTPVANAPLETSEQTETNESNGTSTAQTPAEEPEAENPSETRIGSSVDNRDITAYHYGTGTQELLFVGGIHGGYSANTTLVAYELMDYLEENPEKIPEGYRVTVIPVLNPDGLFKITGSEGRFTPPTTPLSLAATIPGRFNAHDVDLNRNFDCEWQAKGTWQTRTVSGGTAVFSEPEAQAVRDYVASHDIAGAVVWYSAAGGVFASTCKNGISDDTQALTNAYAKASGYRAYQDFDFYEITGDMVNWFAKQDIPAISVLLSSHTAVEWEKNRAGIDAFLNYFAE